jgi:hypothetical protein
MVERIVLLLPYLIKKTRITINIIATATPPIPPTIGPILGSGGGRFTTIKIQIDVHCHCFRNILH